MPPLLVARDKFGLLNVPVDVPATTDDPVADPVLRLLLNYWTAFVNARAAAAWAKVAPLTPVPIFRTFTHDPKDYVFSTAHLPAMYLFRTKSVRSEWIAEDWHVLTDQLKCLWVFPLAVQENARVRRPFMTALPKLIIEAVERSRDVTFVLPDDPDPTASNEGTEILRAGNIWSLYFTDWTQTTLLIRMGDGGQQSYDAVEMNFELSEIWEPDTTVFAPASIQLTTVTSDNGLVTGASVL